MRRSTSLSADVLGPPNGLPKCLTEARMRCGVRRVLKEEKLAWIELVSCEINDRPTNPISSLHSDNDTSAYARNNAEAELLEVTGPAMEASSFFSACEQKARLLLLSALHIPHWDA